MVWRREIPHDWSFFPRLQAYAAKRLVDYIDDINDYSESIVRWLHVC
jgi:hypothetical protein